MEGERERERESERGLRYRSIESVWGPKISELGGAGGGHHRRSRLYISVYIYIYIQFKPGRQHKKSDASSRCIGGPEEGGAKPPIGTRGRFALLVELMLLGFSALVLIGA